MGRHLQLRSYIYLHLMMLLVLVDAVFKYSKHAVTTSDRTDILLLLAVAVAIWVTFVLAPQNQQRAENQNHPYSSPAARLGMLGLIGVLLGLSVVMR